MATLMGITTVTIAIQVLVLALHHHPPNKHPPRWMKKCLASLHWSSNAYSTRARHGGANRSKYDLNAESYKEDCPVDPEIMGESSINAHSEQQVTFRHVSKKPIAINNIEPPSMQASGKNCPVENKDIDFALQSTAISDSMTYMAGSLYRKQNNESIVNQWRNISADLDSLFFWVFLIILSLTTVIILGILPLTHPDPSMDPHSLGLYNV